MVAEHVASFEDLFISVIYLEVCLWTRYL